MHGFITLSEASGRVVMNTFKVDAKLRNCLVPQDTDVMPLFVFKIDRWIPEITVLKWA